MIHIKANQWIGCLVLFLLAVVVSEPVVPTPNPNPNEKILSRLLSFIDNQTDPCDNFFKYAGDNYGYLDFLYELELKVNERFKSIFETLSGEVSLDKSSVEAKVLSFYQTCRTATNESRSLKHYLELVPPDSGTVWPHFNSSHQSGHMHPTLFEVKEHPYPFEWMPTLARLRRYGLNDVLFKMNITLDPVDSSKYVVLIDKPALKWQREWDIEDILRKAGMTSEVGIWESHIKFLDETLNRLAKYNVGPIQKLTLGELEIQTGWPWRQYFQIVFDRTFSPDYTVNVLNMGYILQVKRLLELRHTEIVATYIMARFARFLEGTIASNAENEAFDCVKDVRDHMDFGCAILYETQYLGPEKFAQYDTEMQQLFDSLRTRLLARIEANNLKLNLSQRTQLKQMLQAMKLNVGNFPQNQDHRSFVTNFYRDLQLQPSQDFAAAHLKALEVRTSRCLELLDKPAVNGNAYYFLEEGRPIDSADPLFVNRKNTVVLPLDILREPFYISESHDVFKVSLLGFMLGRQMARSLHPEALIYDGDGKPTNQFLFFNLNPNYRHAVYMISKYSDYGNYQPVEDVTALKLTHDVYFGVGAKYSQEQPSFTHIPLQQLFFMNLAQNLFGYFHDVYGDQPGELRLNQAVASLYPFAEAFNCSIFADMRCLCGPHMEFNVW
ncbi:hypothetical protein KR059_007254 [Drosophila kikkawai]|nr:hypothetical protein KR059_007254 [Drosophila kikkawai]